MKSEHRNAAGLIQRVWSYAHVLKDDGLAFMDYTEQITYLLFLKMAWEKRQAEASDVPSRYTWGAIRALEDNAAKLARYHQGLRKLSEQTGLLGLIFTKPQSKITDPAKLNLLMQMIDAEEWSSLDLDVKGEVYEGLLARNADDVRGGAGQYFTPRAVIRAVVEVMRPTVRMRIADPACGTGGFLLGAFEYLNQQCLSPDELIGLRTRTLRGVDLVPNVARLCAMNLFLHGIGTDPRHPVVSIADSLESRVEPVDMVLTNPPFGKKSSVTIIGEGGKGSVDKLSYQRPDFWATTSNKQLNFVQHVYSMLKSEGRAAMVVPDNVLFEGGAGEAIRRTLLHGADVHTLLRLPTGIWYSPGVKANVMFFDKRRTDGAPATKETWIYDLRSRGNFSLRQKPIRAEDLRDFVACYSADDRSRRQETPVFRRFPYSVIAGREKASLDIQWDDDLAVERLERPRELMADILRDLAVAMREFAAAEETLRPPTRQKSLSNVRAET
jgi:type I restriction enzyme M protein